MKKLILIPLAITCITVSKAQMVSYRVTENDVSDIKRINVQINPFYAEIYSGVNFAVLGASASAEVSILKRLELRGEFRMAYLDGNSGRQELNKLTGLLQPTCKGGTKRSNYFEAGASMYFFNCAT